jgi:proteasome lid subunit RPN8/RPN11
MSPTNLILQTTPSALKKDRCHPLLVVLGICLLLESNVWSDGTSSLPELKISDCKIFNLFCDLWKASCFVKTSLTSERAAWIQYDVKNGYEFLWWPEPSTKTLEYVPSVTWKGDVPSNVIALAHTHPKNPKPSKKDISVAKRLKISIYAISRSAIWRVAPDGKLNMIASKDWYHRENNLCRPQFTKYLTPYGRQ